MCAELADLALQLARAAAARTLTNWSDPEPAPESAPTLAPTAAQPAEPQPEADARPRPTSHRAEITTYRPIDPAVLFTRLAATVRDCIALENRIAATATAPGKTTRAAQLRADPRRAPLRDAFAHITKNLTDGAQLLRDAGFYLDNELADDPDQTIEPAHLMESIANELNIEINWSKLPDEFLFATSPITPDFTDDFDQDPEDPHATSPP